MENISIDEADLMLDRRSIAGMCLLHTSMVRCTLYGLKHILIWLQKWLAKKMMQMRFISAQANESMKRESEHFDRQRRWTLIAAQKPADTNHVYIPLNEETAA
jgi:exocyst complex component 4